MAHHQFTVDIAAPIEQVYDLWTNLERMSEWIEGVTKVTDVTGPAGQAGTRYTVWFGSMRSPSEILEAERPHRLRSRFGNRLLRGETNVTFEPSTTRYAADPGVPNPRQSCQPSPPGSSLSARTRGASAVSSRASSDSPNGKRARPSDLATTVLVARRRAPGRPRRRVGCSVGADRQATIDAVGTGASIASRRDCAHEWAAGSPPRPIGGIA